jgi:CubicO group peptidase (beta-lactamase class C family)
LLATGASAIPELVKFIVIAGLWLAAQLPAAAENYFTDADTDGIKEFLHATFSGTSTNTCMVIGLVDERGSKIFAAGKLDNGTSQEANGDTVFEIASMTKTFTALLLVDMVERGEMKLDDPVAKYLPESVKVPARNGKEITLLDLATHTAGLPRDPNNLTPTRGLPENPFADYGVERLYVFLRSFTLSRDPGTRFEYSNIGMALLGHALALRACTNYESLVAERICRPLKMESTRVTLTSKLKARLAVGHDKLGKPAPKWDFQVYVGTGGLHSTANDLLKYISANAGLAPCALTPLMERTHVIRHKGTSDHGDTAMAWYRRGEGDQPAMELIGHAGGTGGHETFMGFGKKQRRGVVVLCNQQGGPSPEIIGWLLLKGTRLSPQVAMALRTGSEVVGVGIALDLDRETRVVRITKVIPNSPASQAGLSAGLILQRIDDVSTTGKGLTECAALIRGLSGTKVRLELVDSQDNTTNTLELTRQKFLTSN